MSVAVRSNHPVGAWQLKTATKSVFSVDGVPVIMDEDTVVCGQPKNGGYEHLSFLDDSSTSLQERQTIMERLNPRPKKPRVTLHLLAPNRPHVESLELLGSAIRDERIPLSPIR
jgi:hypothetical protein